MTPRHRRCPTRPFDRGVEVCDLNAERAAKLLFRVGERAFLHEKLAANERDSSRGVRLLEYLGTDQHACVIERLRVRLERVHSCSEGFWAELLSSRLVIVEQEGVSHSC